MNREEILKEYLKYNNIPDEILKRIKTDSILTDGFSFLVFRIGNSIGNYFEIGVDIILLGEIARRYNLKLDTTEHVELQTKNIEFEDIDNLIEAVKLFYKIKKDQSSYNIKINKIKAKILAEFF